MDAMLLYCIEEGNWCEDGRKVIFKSEKDRQAYAKAVNKYLQYSILLSELLEYKELEAYYLKAYDRLDYEALGYFSNQDWFEVRNTFLLNILNHFQTEWHYYRVRPIYWWSSSVMPNVDRLGQEAHYEWVVFQLGDWY